MLDTNTPARLRLLWPMLTQDEKDTLEAEGTITRNIYAVVNMEVDRDVYMGKIDVQARYRHTDTDELIASDLFLTTSEEPNIVRETLIFGVSRSVPAQLLLVQANGGTMPTILPVRAEPAPEPEPITEPEPDETP